MKWKVLLFLLLLSGCGLTPQGDAFRAAVRDTSEKVADAEIDNLIWGLCNAISVGALKRKFPEGSKKLTAYKEFCGE